MHGRLHVIRRWLVLVALAVDAGFSPRPAWAVAPGRSLAACNVDVWRTRDGLPGAWIRAVTQTPDGYLWIGTQGGLARYGGGAVVPVEADRSIAHASDVVGLWGARDGTVWLTPSRGLPICVRGDSYQPCVAQPPADLPQASTPIADVRQDSAGVMWIATRDRVLRWQDNQLTVLPADPAWQGAQLTAVHHDDRGNLWVGTSRGLFMGQKRLTEAPVISMFAGHGGQLWVAAEKTLVHVTGDRVESSTWREGLPDGRLTKVIEDRDGNVWIGSREGLIRFQPDLEPGHQFARYTQADGLPDNDVSALFEDREGSLWVGTLSGGLAQFTDRTLDRQSSPPSTRNLWISTVAEDETGALWVGSAQGLTRYRDGDEQTFTRAHGLPSNDVLTLTPGRSGEIWVGTQKGLARFSDGHAEVVPGISGEVTALNLDRWSPPGAGEGKNRGTALWIGGNDGLARRQEDGRIERFTPHPELGAKPLPVIRCVERDDQGTAWLSANGKLLRVEGNQLRTDSSPAGLAIGRVRALARDSDGTLWLGTGAGLVRRRQGSWRIFGGDVGLGRSDLFQVVPDDRGFLWLGATHAVLQISKASLDDIDKGRRRSPDVVSFDILDQRREGRATRTRQPGAWKGNDGRVWFATSRGVVSIDPRHLHVNHAPPPVLIEQATVDGHAAHRGGDNSFPPGSGAFEFHFAAITLLEPHKALHRYKLEGFDLDWVEAGTRRAAYYTRMNPGHYRFRVQGSNADGVWNEVGDAIDLTLAPHFYQTTWFFGLVGLGALAIALSFHRLRLDRLRARYVATTAERARMARELHDSLLQGMAGTLMHLRGLRKRFAPEAAAAPPAMIATEIKEIEALVSTNIEETRGMLSDLRDQPGPDSEDRDSRETVELAPALGVLVERVAPPASQRPASAGPATDVHLVVEGTPPRVPRHVQRELLRIAHEALTNALKHAGAMRVDVRLFHGDAALRLSVCDDGRGFDPQTVAGVTSGHFGLTGMRERAALLGQFHLDSQPGRGTTVSVLVNMKDLRDA